MNSSEQKQPQPVPIQRRIFSIRMLLVFGIGAALIIFLATRFNPDWSGTWDNVRRMNPWLYLLAILLYYLSFGFRGARWQMLARNARTGSLPAVKVPSAARCGQLILVGWFVNSVAWLRLGDAYRAYAFAEESKGGFSWSLGTVLAERLLDMAVVLGLLTLGLILLAATGSTTASNYLLVVVIILAVSILAIVLVMKLYGARVAKFLPRRIEAAYYRFHQGTIGSLRQLPWPIFLGLLGWLLEIARLYFVVQALGLELSLPLVAVVALGEAVLSTVPTPGGLGAVEPGMTALLLLNLERHDAVSVTLVDRSITYLSVILFGGLMFLWRQLAQARRARSELLTVRLSGE